MKSNHPAKSMFSPCILIALSSLAIFATAKAQSPALFSKLNVGDGTGTVAGDGTFVAEGKYGVSPLLDATYQTEGSRMFWYPRKSAFRVGYGSLTSWNEATLGNYSTAMGYSNVASGESSTAFGSSNTASGVNSLSLGFGNYADGAFSTAIGYNNQASVFTETVIGIRNKPIFGNPDYWSPSDPIFQIGNGHDEVSEIQAQADLNGDGLIDSFTLPETDSNALTVYKNGNMELQGDLTLGGEIISNGSPVLTSSSTFFQNFPQISPDSGALDLTGSMTAADDSFINNVRIGRGNGNIASNTALGLNALNSNSTGQQNTASGGEALAANTTGRGNVATGYIALSKNTTGFFNLASGYNALSQNTRGHSNTAVGLSTLSFNTTGYLNVAIGRDAARLRGTTKSTFTAPTKGIYIGAYTRGLTNTETNSIVIGYGSISEGSNTTVIGNSNTKTTHLRGETNTESLKVEGQTILEGQVIISTPQGDISMGDFK